MLQSCGYGSNEWGEHITMSGTHAISCKIVQPMRHVKIRLYGGQVVQCVHAYVSTSKMSLEPKQVMHALLDQSWLGLNDSDLYNS